MFIYNSVLAIYGILWAKNVKFKKTQEKNLKFIQIFMVDISGLVCKRLYIRVL